MLTAAVIGCGRMGASPASRLGQSLPPGWAPLSHAESLQHVDGVRLVALCDADDGRLEAAGAHYGTSALYRDHRTLLDEVRPDIVCIATRTQGRATIIQDACARGVRGIFAEKPLANSVAECRGALDAVRAAGVVLFYGVNRRYHPTYRRARELIAEGVVGTVLDVSVEHGRALLLWAHPHSVDLMMFLLGSTDVREAEAHLDATSVECSKDDVVDTDPVVEHAQFTFESGARGTITRLAGCNVRIGGTAGTLMVRGDGTSLEIDTATPKQPGYLLAHAVEPVPPGSGATVTALRELVEAVRGASARAIAPAEIQTGIGMLMGCVWSHLNGNRVVSLAEVPPDLVVRGRHGSMYA
jgi:scyllo-inositol 2-dehydrogenase (NAD+)